MKEFHGTHKAYTFTVSLLNPEDADILASLLDKSKSEINRSLREMIRAGYNAKEASDGEQRDDD